MNIKLENELKEFKKSHYLNADFNHWVRKVISLYNKLNRLKNKNKQDLVILDLYTTYLQSLEILFINIFALSNRNDSFPGALFIDSKSLRRFIEDSFLKTTSLSVWFLDKCIFQIQVKDDVFKERYKQYSTLIKECAKDYIEDYDLLNAYKHGYRLQAKYEKLSLALVTKDGQKILLNESDSHLKYFSKEKVDGVNTIFEKTINFKNDRIFGKALFICSLLNNMRITILLSLDIKSKDKLANFDLNKETWMQSFGGSKFKKPIFSLK